jgi:hypothetical protein
MHAENIQNINLIVDNYIIYVNCSFPLFSLVHVRDGHSIQHHLWFGSSCQITPPANDVPLMLFQRNGRRRSNLVVIGSWRVISTDRTRRSDPGADRRPTRTCSVWRAPSDS